MECSEAAEYVPSTEVCPDCGKVDSALHIQAMGCCFNCAHNLGDCQFLAQLPYIKGGEINGMWQC